MKLSESFDGFHLPSIDLYGVSGEPTNKYFAYGTCLVKFIYKYKYKQRYTNTLIENVTNNSKRDVINSI